MNAGAERPRAEDRLLATFRPQAPKATMKKRIVVSPSAMASTRRLLVLPLAIGLLFFFPAWALARVSRLLMSDRVVATFLSIGTIMTCGGLILAMSRRAIATRLRAALCGAGFGIGITSLPVLTAKFSIWLKLVNLFVVGSVFAGIATGVWIALCQRFGPIRINDGSQCPNCGYCVLGCVRLVCPECGRRFTLGDIGTTDAEFEARRSQLSAGARDASY